MNFATARFDPTSAARALAPGEKDYVYHDPQIALAVNVALVTHRPLLVTGSPGSGKSTLAADVARRLGWAYLGTTITSRTRLDDLTGRFDAVARLNDAQAAKAGGQLKPPAEYVVPGVLWWAFGPASAAGQPGAKDPRVHAAAATNGTVVLLDEIDKAEPDVPNDLLGPLDYPNRLELPLHPQVRATGDVLVVITSNGERAMPPAFLRRCIAIELDDELPGFFTAVATAHFGPRPGSLYADVAQRTIELGREADREARRRPSMAEYLDTLRACIDLGESPSSGLWAAIEEAALRKSRANDTTTAPAERGEDATAADGGG